MTEKPEECLPLKNDRLLKTIRHEPVDKTPIWIMRQAGRYLPEYRATRERAGSFMHLCQTPELACEVTLQPLTRYPLDAAIIFSDILTIPHALGLGLEFIEGKGPILGHPLQTEAQIVKLAALDLSQLEYVYDAIRLVKHELDQKIPLIGFCGSPFTLAAYMVQGESQPQFPLLMKMLTDEPKLLHSLLKKLANSVSLHLKAQVQAGVDIVMIFDTWGGLLSDPLYELFSLQYIQTAISDLSLTYNKEIPVILFTKGGGKYLEAMAETGCQVLGIDWETSLNEARTRVGSRVALQGNLNPRLLLEKPEMIRQAVEHTLASFGKGSGHIFNLGHGITPDVPPENVAMLIEWVHELSQPYHQ